MAVPTLLDIAKANGSDAVVGLIDETTKAHPEIRLGAARTIRGINYKTLVRTGLPTASFRAANAGTASVKGQYENRLVESFILNPRWECDKAVADKHEDGAEAFIAMEASAIMEASFVTLAKQFYYGITQGGDPLGFPGLLEMYDSTNMVVDAGGTTATTGSSVWAVKFGVKEVQWVWGQGGALEMSDVRTETVLDPTDSTKKFTAYVQELLAYPGLQVGTFRALGRIKKLTADSGKGLTDILLAQLLSKFEVGIVPDVFLMSRRSLAQLQASRTATNPTGTPAPFPDSAFGIPIALTDAILDTEALTL